MKYCTYKDCFEDFVALTGLEGAPENLIKSRFNAWFNIRLREIWRAARWSFLIKTVPVPVCENSWVDLPADIENGDIFEVFNRDFRTNKNAQRVRFYIENGDSIICPNLKTSKLNLPLWNAQVNYEPGDAYEKKSKKIFVLENDTTELTGKIFAQGYIDLYGETILKNGDIVLVCDGINYGASVFFDGEYFAISGDVINRDAVIRYKAINPEFKLDDECKTLPYAFKSFIAQAARANWLSAENRPEEARSAEEYARMFLEDEIFRDANPYSITPTNFY